MAQDDLARAAGIGLAAGAGRDLLNLATTLDEGVDVFGEAGAID